MAVVAMFIRTVLPTVITAYHVSSEAGQLATTLINWHLILSILIWPEAFVIPHSLRSAGDVRFTMFVSISTMWIFRVGLSYFFCYFCNTGASGVWYAMFIDWFFRGAFFVARMLGSRWTNKKVI